MIGHEEQALVTPVPLASAGAPGPDGSGVSRHATRMDVVDQGRPLARPLDAPSALPPTEWRRVRTTAAWLFAHRADLLAALVYGCLVYLSFNALADYANGHRLPSGQPLFPHPYGGWAFAVAIDGAVLYAFISFKRAPWLAGVLLTSSAAATYTLQRWHAEGRPHPLVVAGVVPGAMVLVTFAWHRIRAAEGRPGWDPKPPARPDPDPDPDEGEDQDDDPDQRPAQPEPLRTRPRVAQDGAAGRPAARGGPAFTPAQLSQIRTWVDEDRSASWITRELGLSDRARKEHVGPLVRQLKDQPAQVGYPNGLGGGS